MKKNRMMRIASVMLVFALLTTCIISGTFAKYVSTDTATDKAYVAKWGVTVDGTGNLFAKNYLPTGSGDTAAPDDAEKETVTVKSTTRNKLVAPGTKGRLGGFTVDGSPEVTVDVTYSATLTLTGWTTTTCPIVVKINGEVVALADVESTINALSTRYYVGDTISAGITFEWEWAWEDNDAANTRDNGFGNDAADASKTTPAIELTVTATISQVN